MTTNRSGRCWRRSLQTMVLRSSRSQAEPPRSLCWMRANSADALVSDLSMPGMDGVALIRAAQERRPHMPAILLTGYAGDVTAFAVGKTFKGPFSLLRKPISGMLLADGVAMLLAATATATASHTNAGPDQF